MMYDLLVIGAGPAGLSAAYTAAKAGIKVAVLEKSKEIGYPIHSSGGSWIDELKQLDIPERFMNPIREGLFISPSEKAEFRYAVPPSCILDVRGLYQYLAELASAEGAEIFVNTSVLAPWFEANKISGVSARRVGQEMIFKAPLIVDASGIAAVIARKVGLTKGFRRYGIGAEYDLYAPFWPQHRVAFLFGSKYAPAGYAWVFPYKGNRVRLGVGTIYPDSAEHPKQYLEKILSDSHIFKDELSQISRLEYHTGVIPGELYLRKSVANGVIVVGDAGALISTLVGEGIRFAIDIGRMAGQIAADAILRKRYDEKYLSKFETMWQKKYKKTFQIGAFINNRLARYSDQQWDRRIKALSNLEPQLIPALLKGDFNARILLKIVQSNPGFLKKSVQSAFKSFSKNA